MQNRGIIISNIANLYVIEDVESERQIKCSARGKFKDQNISPVVGDYINYSIVDDDKSEGVIDEIYERKTYIKRPKIANLTQILLMISMKMPKPDLLMLDKQLAFAEFNGIKPIICLNKIDLEDANEIELIEREYKAIGYQVLKTDCREGIGIDKIKEILDGNITAFSGNSGVGKSSLINQIFAYDVTVEGNLSLRNKRGKNTTTSTYLYKLSEDTYIADTPGFSTFDISEIPLADLYKYFIEFREEEKNCQFVGCTHIKEEECGIKEAVKSGKISENRYNRFCKIYTELKEKEAHKW